MLADATARTSTRQERREEGGMQSQTRRTQAPVLDLRNATFSRDAEIIQRSDVSYDDARRVWNRRIDKHPAAIVRCATVGDVVAAVRIARERDVPLAVRAGGHGVTGPGTCDGGLVIDLRPMRDVAVQASAFRARVGGGATCGDLDRATGAAGLAATSAIVSSVGVAGLMLGGGFGWLSRAFGLTADHLISASVVMADGRLVTASEEDDPELLWALRGGGGNFGIVTSFELALHAIGPVTGGLILHGADRLGDALGLFREFADTASDELTVKLFVITAPPAPFVPEWLRGQRAVALVVCHVGSVDRAAKELEPLRRFGPPAMDLVAPMPYPAMQQLLDASVPVDVSSGSRACYADELSDGAIDALVEGSRRMTPPSVVHVHHLGGAVAGVAEHATAFANRDARFAINVLPSWQQSVDEEPVVGWADDLWRAMQPLARRGVYSNFLDDEGPVRVREAYGDNYERLVGIKRRVDPENLFRINQNIPPT
jgi:FAD/FMN-containing dehydrogenase